MAKQNIQPVGEFNKIYEFQRQHAWKLPETAYLSPQFEIKELQSLKTHLNTVKSRLSQFDLGEWSLHTQNRYHAGYVISTLRKKVHPELLTQAWCKFYEILCKFPVVHGADVWNFRSLHLCEAPGAFICALNHYLVLNFPDVSWNWQANTLNPYYEGNSSQQMIGDDRLIRYTLSMPNRWLFGSDLTGNLMHYHNYLDIVDQVQKVQNKVDLVTADGSVDCMSNPGEQESLVAFLHYCEAMTALSVLSVGGTFILKIFTMFEQSTVCLLYLLNNLFNKVAVFKPCTSKSGNSEVYVVCLGFNGVSTLSVWDMLLKPYKHGNFCELSMFSQDSIHHSFLEQVRHCALFFAGIQMETIEHNIFYYSHSDDKKQLHLKKILVAKQYIKLCKLQKIENNLKVVPWINVGFPHEPEPFPEGTVQVLCMPQSHVASHLNFYMGKPIECVKTSRFKVNINTTSWCHYSTRQSWSLYNLALSKLNTTTTIINSTDYNYCMNPYFMYQKKVIALLQSALKAEKHILILNLPLHTHFLASIVTVMSGVFQDVYFGPGWCLFYNCQRDKVGFVNEIFLKIHKLSQNTHSDLLYLFSPDLFYTLLSPITRMLLFYNKEIKCEHPI